MSTNEVYVSITGLQLKSMSFIFLFFYCMQARRSSRRRRLPETSKLMRR